MTHDPLCPTHSIDSTCADHCDDQCLGYQDCYQRCHCSLIAKVRDSAQLSPLSSVLAAISEGTAPAHRPPTHRQRLTNDKPTIDDPMAHDPGVQTSSEVADSATSGASLAPSHDPMCYFNRPGGEFDFMADRCARCDLIAKVRADERGQDESEDDRKTERDRVARTIVDSETFMWLMGGSEREAHYLRELRHAYLAYCKDFDGGYGRWADRQRNKPWLDTESDRGES